MAIRYSDSSTQHLLESPSIVQRHVNSLLLGEFLKELTANSDLNLLRQNCDWFFWAEDPNDAPALQMLEWCRYLPRDERIESALRHLVRQSVLEGRSSRQLCTETADRLKLVIARWRRELDALQKQLQDLQLAGRDQDTSRAIKVVEIAIHRLKIEYLLVNWLPRAFFQAMAFPMASSASIRLPPNSSIEKSGPVGRLTVTGRIIVSATAISLSFPVYRNSGICSWSRSSHRRCCISLEGISLTWQNL